MTVKTNGSENHQSNENGIPGKKKRYLKASLIIFLIVSFLICLFILSTDNKSAGAAAEFAGTDAPTDSPAPTPALTPTPTPAPTPMLTPVPTPTPTPDPNDAYFTESEQVLINEDKTEWTYSSPDIYIHITRYDVPKEKLHYFVSDIRTRNNQILKSGFSDPKHPGRNALLPKKIARKLSAVYLQNGDYFEDKRNPKGIIIRGGKIYKEKKGADTLAIMPDGTLKIYKPGEIKAQALLDMGVMDTFSFGPTLINNGEITQGLEKARLRRANPRSGIGMIEKGHYIGIVVEGRNPKSCRGVTLKEFAQMFAEQGCTVAYNLDGGVSSAMVFMGENLNLPTNVLKTKTYRRVPDVIMLGTSDLVPEK